MNAPSREPSPAAAIVLFVTLLTAPVAASHSEPALFFVTETAVIGIFQPVSTDREAGFM